VRHRRLPESKEGEEKNQKGEKGGNVYEFYFHVSPSQKRRKGRGKKRKARNGGADSLMLPDAADRRKSGKEREKEEYAASFLSFAFVNRRGGEGVQRKRGGNKNVEGRDEFSLSCGDRKSG